MTRDEEERAVQRAIGQVLLNHWDPIGVKDVPEAQDEYDCYVGGVYRLLASGATPRQIAEHLARVEKEEMGFDAADPSVLLPLATRLCQLDVRLGSRGGAT